MMDQNTNGNNMPSGPNFQDAKSRPEGPAQQGMNEQDFGQGAQGAQGAEWKQAEPNAQEPIEVVSETEVISENNPVMQSFVQKEAPVMQDKSSQNKGKKTVAIVVIIVAVLGALGVLIWFLISGGVGMFGFSGPTPRIAKSVCEKYGGDYFEDESNSRKTVSCFNYSDNVLREQQFSFVLMFLNRDDSKRYWEEGKTLFDVSSDTTVVLENSDSYIKAYSAKDSILYNVLYGNVAGTIETPSNIDLIENLLIELKFPDRNRADAEDIEIVDCGDGNCAEKEAAVVDEAEASQYDAEIRDDMRMLQTEILNVLNSGDNSGVTASNDTIELSGVRDILEEAGWADPVSGDTYAISAYDSFEDSEFSSDVSLLNTWPSNEMIVFYHTKCDGEAFSSDEKSYTVVHSSVKQDKFYCVSN